MSLLALLLCLSGCYTQRRAERQVYKAHLRYRQVTAQYCNAVFDPVVHVVDSYIYRPGAAIFHTDTVAINCDSVVAMAPLQPIVKLPCPPCASRTDTVYRMVRTQVENRARIALLEQERSGLQQELAKSRAKYKMLLWPLTALAVYTLLRWLLRIWGIRLP